MVVINAAQIDVAVHESVLRTVWASGFAVRHARTSKKMEFHRGAQVGHMSGNIRKSWKF